MMVLGFLATWAAKLGASRVPTVGQHASSIGVFIPEIIIGPVVGCLVARRHRKKENERAQAELFQAEKKTKQTDPSTSSAI